MRRHMLTTNLSLDQWRIRGVCVVVVVGVITPPPLVAENFVCSNSNFSPTGAITPPPPSGPPGRHPPPLRKSCIRACRHKTNAHTQDKWKKRHLLTTFFMIFIYEEKPIAHSIACHIINITWSKTKAGLWL